MVFPASEPTITRLPMKNPRSAVGSADRISPKILPLLAVWSISRSYNTPYQLMENQVSPILRLTIQNVDQLV